MKVVVRNTKVKRKKTIKSVAFWLTIAVVLLFAVMSYNSLELQKKKRALEATQRELQAKIQEEQERTEELAERRAYMQTIRYVEEIAREVLGLVYPDEVIVRPEAEK